MKKIRAQVDRLKEAYPGRHINISLSTSFYASTSSDLHEWNVYVADSVSSKFKTFKEVVAFIDNEVKL